eukprot:scpid41083/ scgid6578/ Neutral and basic amino acid transport protein rBAT; B(0,+)-type amino acid transport protein; D2h
MSEVLDLLNEESRQRYLDRACKDGYAVLPDLEALKNRVREKERKAIMDGQREEVSAADAEPNHSAANGAISTSVGTGIERNTSDKTRLLADEDSEDSGRTSGSDTDDDNLAVDDDDDYRSTHSKAVVSMRSKRSMAAESQQMSRQMRFAYWFCFAVVFGAGVSCIVLLILASPTCNTNNSDNGEQLAWWQRNIIYQVYPRSLQDSNNDGIGDLRGISSRVDYLRDLGIRTVWLSPMFESPMVDFGYDISNYTNVDPIFGNLTDFDELIRALHDRGMQLLLDFVPNHTSDKHAWFTESSSSGSNPKRDWYIWQDAASDGGPPNNWQSLFGGSAWQYDNRTQQYYFHQFTKEQPDLNYRNPHVRAAMEDVLRFWLRRGVDGFRVDAIAFLLEDAEFRNETCTLNGSVSVACHEWNTMNHSYTFAQPGFHAIVRSFREVLDSSEFFNATHPKFMVGEMYAPELEDVLELYGNASSPECHFPFNFLLIGLQASDWTGRKIGNVVGQWLNATSKDQWPNWVLGNHDNKRVASRLGASLARTANFLLLTLPGTPTTYYGEEIGMIDGNVTWNETVDPSALNTGDISLSRDPERTPMQWDNSSNSGFTSAGVDTWLPVASTYTEVNVAAQLAQPRSMLQLYKRLAQIRSSEPALQHSSYRLIHATDALLAYAREYTSTTDGSGSTNNQYLVVLNFASTASKAVSLTGSGLAGYQSTGHVQLSASLSTNVSLALNLSAFDMPAGEAYLVKLTPS